jgi:DNA-binding CsgD family transcriptional regulator/tetratricopeptide (TPR) repeat protein
MVGHPEEAGRWLYAAEVVATSAKPGLRAALLYELVRYELNFGGDRERAERLLDDALRIHEELGNDAGKAWALTMLSNVAADRGDRGAAADRARRAVAFARTVEKPLERTRLLAESANMGSAARSLAEARALAEEALASARDLGDPVSLTDSLVALGSAALATGDVAHAVESFSEALAIQGPAGPDIHWVMQSLAPALLRAGDIDGSRRLLEDALVGAREKQAIWLALAVLEAAADWLGAVGRPDHATALWAAIDARRAVQMDRTYNDDVGLYIPSRERDRAALSAGAYEGALASGKAMQVRDALDYASDALETAAVESAVASAAGHGRHGRYDLTPREQEVLQLVAVGRSNDQIAARLFISKKTAAVHVGNIKGKLGAGNRVEIVTIAQARGLVALMAAPQVVDG